MEEKVVIADALVDLVETMIADQDKRDSYLTICSILVRHYKSIGK